MNITRFEDLDCWKKARELVREIYIATSRADFSLDFGLKDQIRRSSVSVVSNIAEGFEVFSDVEFIRFLSYSSRSASEVQSQLYVALDVGYLSHKEFDKLYDMAELSRRLCKGLIKYLRGHKDSKTQRL